ncbi:MAG TPA: hypothetical protein VHB27_06390 [Rhodopila sp.]|uniref:hypothetical protein n=1 Tax=Rhodopila sp. TaxID=2480087 RepID=UPI002BED17E2|nr:hypothetical protein [Rhodopila sp.]HVY14836.1 hypothetical protein [Rhodopila sp.]
MTPHYVQEGTDPALTGGGTDTLSCQCGQALIEAYDPRAFLAVTIRCGACGTITETPPLPAGAIPPAPLLAAEDTPGVRTVTAALAAGGGVASRAEVQRITGLYSPRTPPSNVYAFTDALLDDAQADFERLTGAALPDTPAAFKDGLAAHALAWSVRHLRERLRAGDWACLESQATSIACVTVAGFRHFVATWSVHPLFPAMVATAGDRGFSAHGLALFAAAHCLLQQRNRVGFPAPVLGRLAHVRLGTSPTQSVPVLTKVFDRFEVPWGRPWDPASLRSAVREAIESEQGRINLLHPGVLLLSPGAAMTGFDEALIQAVQSAMQAIGRRHPGLMAAVPVVLRLLPGPRPQAVQFGYGLFPIHNQHFRNETALS